MNNYFAPYQEWIIFFIVGMFWGIAVTKLYQEFKKIK